MSDTTCICTALRLAALQATETDDRLLEPSGLKVTMYRTLALIGQAG